MKGQTTRSEPRATRSRSAPASLGAGHDVEFSYSSLAEMRRHGGGIDQRVLDGLETLQAWDQTLARHPWQHYGRLHAMPTGLVGIVEADGAPPRISYDLLRYDDLAAGGPPRRTTYHREPTHLASAKEHPMRAAYEAALRTYAAMTAFDQAHDLPRTQPVTGAAASVH